MEKMKANVFRGVNNIRVEEVERPRAGVVPLGGGGHHVDLAALRRFGVLAAGPTGDQDDGQDRAEDRKSVV